MKRTIVFALIYLAVVAPVAVFFWKQEERSAEEAFAHLMESPLSTGLTAITQPGSGRVYYSAKYRARRHEGFEVFEIGKLRLIKRGYSKDGPVGASGGVILPGTEVIPGFGSIYADEIEVFGQVFEIDGDVLLIGSSRLQINSAEPQRLAVDANWHPGPGNE